jgi:hypothetical protein
MTALALSFVENSVIRSESRGVGDPGSLGLGHITKEGNSLLHFLLVEAAQAATTYQPGMEMSVHISGIRRHKRIAKIALERGEFFWDKSPHEPL